MTEWLWCLYDGDGMQKTAARHRRQDKGDGGSRTTANNGEADGFDGKLLAGSSKNIFCIYFNTDACMHFIDSLH
jgi:hypothetical protein